MLRQDYDTVLIDTPPLLLFSDARLISFVSDGVVMVLRSGITDRESAVAARTRLVEDGIRIFGIILNEVYGTALTAPMDEEHPLNPRSPYAATKAGADRLAYSYFVTYGLPIVIVRPFNNYGPRQHSEKAIPRFVTQAFRGEPLTIHGDGHASRDWLYVDDDAEAIEAIIAAPLDAVAGEVLNVATGIDISIGEVADLVLELVGKPPALKLHVPERPGQVDRHIGSTEKIRRLCGWSARTSFEEGLARTVAWYRENEAWWRATERPKAKLSSS